MRTTDEEHEPATTAKTTDQRSSSSGRVKQICQNFLLHADSGLAHRLQQEEFALHFDRNRTHRRDSQLGVRAARDVEQEEQQAFAAKQVRGTQHKQQMEEIDTALARQLQNDLKAQPHAKDRRTTNTHFRSRDKQDYYEAVADAFAHEDTSSDEQLARILQEEERLLSASAHRSLYKSALV